jgi:serine/threonine protein kinase
MLQAVSGQGRYLIASCDEGQKSFECADLRHGLFTYHLLRGIEGKADSDGDGRVGLTELFNYVSNAVSREARERFGREQKPWTSATYAEETYISSPKTPTIHSDTDSFERIWREQGSLAAIREIEQTVPKADEPWLRRAVCWLGRIKEPVGIPTLFRCLSHASAPVRNEARAALHSFGWETVVSAAEGVARSGEPEAVGAILDGLNAFEAHPRVVALLDRLVIVLKSEMRNRAILLLERKRLGLELESVAALFREIHSPYQIQKVLGQGLFTDTYLARDENTGLEVAVRVLRPEFANQPHVRAAFLDLSKRSVSLIHEKLALTREARVFPDRNIYFAVRDYVDGVTLQRVLETGKHFGPVQVIRIVREVAEALTPLHRKAMCHGGIKPSNIFLCRGQCVVLGDPCLPLSGMGLALDRLAYDYRYSPPEMFLARGEIGPPSDYYALGCVAYELLCRAPPFVSDNFHELAAKHINESIIPPAQRGSPLGAMGDEIILKLLARSPRERYGALEEVFQALDDLNSAAFGEQRIAPGSRPLLRDVSIMNYQAGHSMLNFEQTSGTASGGMVSGPGDLAADEKSPLQIPGYEILEELGRGGMGIVFKAVDKQLNRTVALKVLRSDAVAPFVEQRSRIETQQESRLHTEAQAIARLQHPNIVQIYGMFQNEGFICLALEYVGGGDLDGKIRALAQIDELMPIREAAALTATLARAVEFAHQQGILHRDLKPSNILLTVDGQPKIVDFGLAKRLDTDSGQTRTNAVMGTPSYMAPEQAGGRAKYATPATDVYALGAILYEALTGQPPFKGASVLETLGKVVSTEPIAPRALRVAVPRELDVICLKCLEKKQANRYASAAALADDLERWVRENALGDISSGVRWKRQGPPSLLRRLVRVLSFGKSAANPKNTPSTEA